VRTWRRVFIPPGSFQTIEKGISRPNAQRSEQRQQGRRCEPKIDFEGICGGCSFSSLPGPFVGCHSLFNGIKPAARKTAHRFAESGYIFECNLTFTNNPNILGFFLFQYGSCDKSRTEKMRV